MNNITLMTVLKKSELFKALNENALKEIAGITQSIKYDKDNFVFFEGQKTKGFYIISEGKAKAVKYSPDGREQIIRMFARGDVFAESCLFDEKYPITVRIISNAELIFIPKENFITLLSRSPSIAIELISVLSKRNKYLVGLIEDLSLKEISARVAKYLIDQAVTQTNSLSDNSKIKIHIKKNQLALTLGTIPETLSRTFKKMQAKKIIKNYKDYITILNASLLQQAAAGKKI